MTARQIGNYRVLDYVGSGGFGSVFKAEDVNSPGRFVAIKELHRKHTRSAVIKQRFFQEALAMARLDHPNIPRLHTFGEDNGSYYLVMEFVSGSALSDEIHDKGPIAPTRAVAVIGQVLEAVSYAHKNGVIHRDLKPDNIILVDRGPVLVKVLDFGIAKMVGGENLTLTGEGFGTPSYMSPERIIGSSELDARTDVYSLGIILFEMIAGHVPFQSKSTDPALYWAEMRRMHQSEPIPDLASFGVPPDLETIIRTATAKNIDERFRTADEMLAALRGEKPACRLVITTSPGEADVFLDNIPRGISDGAKGRVLIEGLTPGVHAVRVTKQGYGPYKIDVSLEPGHATELQVQLPANSTVAIPRLEETAPIDVSTNKIQSGDEAKTAVLMLDSLPAGSAISFGNGRALADEDGRATVALGLGTHDIEVVSPSGATQKQRVTIGNQDLGSLKTIAIPPPINTGAERPAVRMSHESRSTSFVPVAPAPQASSLGKRLAGAASVIIILGLSAAAYFVLRGPGRAPARTQTASTQSLETQPLVPPSAQPTPTPSPVATESVESSLPDAASTPAEKDPNNKDKADPSNPSDTSLALEPPKPEQPIPSPTPASTNPPAPIYPGPSSVPAPPQGDAPPASDGDACVAVSVTGPMGEPVPAVRVLCVDMQAGSSGLRQGRTNGAGRWEGCGLTPGHRVLVRVYGMGGRILAGRQLSLSAGRNSADIQVEAPPPPDARPDRRFRPWRRP